MKRLFAVILIAAFLLVGCSKAEDVSSFVGKTFVYEKEGFGSDFTITINEDGTYSYSEGALSSILGRGEWEYENETLELISGENIICFKVSDKSLVFEQKNSDNFAYISVKDGERFLEKE